LKKLPIRVIQDLGDDAALIQIMNRAVVVSKKNRFYALAKTFTDKKKSTETTDDKEQTENKNPEKS